MSKADEVLKQLSMIAPGDAKAVADELAALKADNAAWVAAVREVVNEDTTAAHIRMADMLKDPHPGAALVERMKRLENFTAYFAKMDCMGCKTNPTGYRGGLCTACGAREALKGGS